MCEKPFVLPDGRKVDCGSCLSCKLKRGREWVARSLIHQHFLRDAPVTVMLTLTYDKEHIPEGYNLRYHDIQLMLKRLRKEYTDYNGKTERRFSYIVCGEYGPKTQRPHYHMILWGLSSAEIKQHFGQYACLPMWLNGFSHIGWLFGSEMISYVVQYTTKKLKKKAYKGTRTPPMLRMSKGIGAALLYNKTLLDKMFNAGYISICGKKYPIPRYYFKKLEMDRGEFYKQHIIKQQEELINKAIEEGIDIVYRPSNNPKYDWFNFKQFYNEMEREYLRGHVVEYQGHLVVLSQEYWDWEATVRRNFNLALNKRINERSIL